MTSEDLDDLFEHQRSFEEFQAAQIKLVQDELNKWAKEFIAACLGEEKSTELFKAADEHDYDTIKYLTDKHKIYWIECPSRLPFTKVLVCGEHKGTFTINPRTLPSPP